jgi:hypothetical protein
MSTKTKTKPIENRILDTVKALAIPTFVIWVGLILATDAFVGFVSGGTGEIFYENFSILYFIGSVFLAIKLRKVIRF